MLGWGKSTQEGVIVPAETLMNRRRDGRGYSKCKRPEARKALVPFEGQKGRQGGCSVESKGAARGRVL